jgi:ubiquitin carboxyl-terminal hydrolase 9/24
MLEDEIAWLRNFEITSNPDLIDADNLILAGHLKLIRTLFTCEGVDKEEFGKITNYWSEWMVVV